MKSIRSGGRTALLLLVFSFLLTGCYGRGAVTDTGWTVVTLDGDRVYSVRSTGEAVALDGADNGDLIWQYPEGGASAAAPGCGILRTADPDVEEVVAPGAVYGAPVIADGLMVFGSANHRLIALDAETGDYAWSYVADRAIVGGVAASDGTVYFGSVDGRVYALDLATQDLVWAAPFQTGDRIWSTPLVAEDRLYVASMDHSIYALDRATGESLWQADLGGAIQGDIALAGSTLLAGGVDRRLHAIDATGGTTRWTTDELDAWVWGRPLVVDSTVYFTTLDGRVHGVSLETGESLWAPVALDGAIGAGPVLVGDSVVVGTDAGKVYVVDGPEGDADLIYGQVEQEQRGGYVSIPAVQDGVVYLGSALGFVVALDPASGDELWVYPSGDSE